MKLRWYVLPVICFVLAGGGTLTAASRLPVAQYGVEKWDRKDLGNHRAVIKVDTVSPGCVVTVPWRLRRMEQDMNEIAVRVFTAAGEELQNVIALAENNESGHIVFEPSAGSGIYYLYYLPHPEPGRYFEPLAGYDKPKDATGQKAWLKKLFRKEAVTDAEARDISGLFDDSGERLFDILAEKLPKAKVIELQARTEFNSFYPMEVAATQDEVRTLLERRAEPYLLFCEDGRHPIKMRSNLPVRWLERNTATSFSGEARPGEYYVFQAGLFAARTGVSKVWVKFADLKNPEGSAIDIAAMTCFNLEGVNQHGDPFAKELDVPRGEVQSLWFGIQVPRDAKGVYRGEFRIGGANVPQTTLPVTLKISGELLADGGVKDIYSLSRLKWLNSNMAEEDTVTRPYTPVAADEQSVSVLNREIRFGKEGFPKSIVSNNIEILSEPAEFLFDTVETGAAEWRDCRTQITERKNTAISRKTECRSDRLKMTVNSISEFDGTILYDVELTALQEVRFRNAALRFSCHQENVPYMMGLGREGGARPDSWRWKWNKDISNNSLWLGDVDCGLQVYLKSRQHEEWNPKFRLKFNGLPDAWDNAGKGGWDVYQKDDAVYSDSYTGSFRLKRGESRRFFFRLMVTPFKPLNPLYGIVWKWGRGGNIINLHHAHTEVNPYINYPFFKYEQLKKVLDERFVWPSDENSGIGDVGSGPDKFEVTYPAIGNLDPVCGAFHIRVRFRFDTTAPYGPNRSLGRVTFSNGNFAAIYWNAKDSGFRTLVSDKETGKYPVLFHSRKYKAVPGDEILISVSWGKTFSFFINGERVAGKAFVGIGSDNVTDAIIGLVADGFELCAAKIEKTTYNGGEVSFIQDGNTLFLEDFSRSDNDKFLPLAAAHGTVGMHRRIHSGRRGTSLYYTVRELTNHAPEIWMLESLGGEVLETRSHYLYSTKGSKIIKPGGGSYWLREHLNGGYVPAWRTATTDEYDAAVSITGNSRWNNFYVEGLNWLLDNTCLDGLYLDGIGYDGWIMRRVARVMSRVPEYRIKLHLGNYFYRGHGGWPINALNLYMEHLPYVTNLWLGEQFDYNREPEYWLVNVSGLSFGLYSTMLDSRAENPYRALLFGMSGINVPYAGIYRLWDEFGLAEAEMLGWWNEDCPVKAFCDNGRVECTVYKKKDKALVALANWSQKRKHAESALISPEEAPSVDGNIFDTEWSKAGSMSGFMANALSPSKFKTNAWVTSDGHYLYFAFKVQALPGIKKKFRKRDQKMWNDDSVELFIQPDIADEKYYHFVGNSVGALFDEENRNRDWNGGWEYHTRIAPDKLSWQCEGRIEARELGLKEITPDTIFGINLGRNLRGSQEESSAWSSGNSFHDLNSFGRLGFKREKGNPSIEKANQNAVRVKLILDWKKLGFAPKQTRISAPSVQDFQEKVEFARDGDSLECVIPQNKGCVLLLERVLSPVGQ